VVEETITEQDVLTGQPTTIEPAMETTIEATIDANIDRNVNDNRIVLAADEASPRATTPPPTIEQILADTPVLNEREAAEALGGLDVTTIEGSKTEKVTNKRKTALSPVLSTPTT
jgi:hypothetical protein